MKCAQCGTQNAESAKFCQECGSPLRMPQDLRCPACGATHSPSAKFCQECGQPLVGGAVKEDHGRLQALWGSAPEGLREKLRAASVRAEGERKPVTILFADIVGSTSIAEGLDPEEWKEIVGGAHRRVGEAVYRYEGTVAQLLGDGVLAFFGAPITHEDDPIRAVHAALDLQEKINEFSAELSGLVEDLQMRVGIHTGEVVIGEIGTDLHVEYLAIGDAVNAAARLQSVAPPGSILISTDCARLLGEGFRLKDLGEIDVKGKAAPIHILEVLGAEGIPTTRRTAGALGGVYVGREKEVEELRSILIALNRGQGGIVALMGEAGIGKSRLVEEVRREFKTEEGSIEPDTPETPIRWLEGRALSYGGSLPYWPITQLILEDLGLSEGAPGLKVKVALRKRLKGLFGDGAEEPFPYLGRLLGIPEEGEVKARLDSLDVESIKAETLGALKAYFRAVAELEPTALVMEDLHWAGPSTLEVLEALMELADRAALLILLVMRVDRDHGSWGLKVRAETDFPHRYSEIHLERLSEAQVDNMLGKLMGEEELPARVRDLIRSRSEGNPLYLEGVARHLVESHLIERTNGGWRATAEIEEVGIPDNLQGLLLARIDQIEADVKRTLQVASVIGRVFSYPLLAAVAGQDRELPRHLSKLQRLDLVREESRLPELEYRFKHSMSQEAAYESLLRERRRDYHRMVAEALESLYGERIEELLGVAAHHFEAGRVLDKAEYYLVKAGDRARFQGALQEAVDYYRRAVTIARERGSTDLAAHTQMKLALTYHSSLDFETAASAYERAFLLWKQAQEVFQEGEIPKAPGPLHLSIEEPLTLDPCQVKDAYSEVIIHQIFRGLVDVSDELGIVPDIAHSWDILDGGRRYIFHLRDDAYWSDGRPLTAEDFELAWRRLLHPGGLQGEYLSEITGGRDYQQGHLADWNRVGIKAEDAHTFSVLLEKPAGHFISLVSSPAACAVPAHVIHAVGEDWTQIEHIVNSGPFRMESWERGSRLILQRNEYYQGRLGGNVEEVHFTFEPWGSTKAYHLYKENELDVYHFSSSPGPDLDRLMHMHAEEYVSSPELSTFFIGLNWTKKPMDDQRVRKALALATDQRDVCGVALRGFNQAALGGLICPGIPGFEKDIGLPFAPDQARSLLEEAGFPGGEGFPSIEFLTTELDVHLAVSEYLSERWGEILGLDVRWEVAPWERYVERIQMKSRGPEMPDIWTTFWSADYPDPDDFFRSLSVRLLSWRENDILEHIRAAQGILDQEERVRLYQEVDRRIVNQAVIIPIAYGRMHHLIKPWVKGFRLTPHRLLLLKDIIMTPHA